MMRHLVGAKNSILINSDVRISNSKTSIKSEVYLGPEFSAESLVVNSRNVQVEDEVFEIRQNNPNPWTDQTTIQLTT